MRWRSTSVALLPGVTVCSTTSSPGGAVSSTLWILYIALVVLIVAGWWQIFTKAGEEGWKAIIPIYNLIVLLKIVGREWWWILLMLIPFVNLIVWILISLDLAKSFGRGVGFAIGLIFLPFVFALILGFGSDTYRGAAAGPAAA
jgi:hypothetical protein